MTSQFEKFENLTEDEFTASFKFWIKQSKFIYANSLLYQLRIAPMLIMDMTNYDQYEEFVMIYNKAAMMGLLDPPDHKNVRQNYDEDNDY